MSEEITRMPAVALRGMTILPSMIVHFDVSRDKSIKAIEQAMTADQKLFVVTQRDPEASPFPSRRVLKHPEPAIPCIHLFTVLYIYTSTILFCK